MVVVEDEGDVLLINGKEYEGFVDDGICTQCSEQRIYSEQHDAFFCAECNLWLEDACSDSNCGYCKGRPWKPLD
jgi:hypothetical protein